MEDEVNNAAEEIRAALRLASKSGHKYSVAFDPSDEANAAIRREAAARVMEEQINIILERKNVDITWEERERLRRELRQIPSNRGVA